MVRIARIFLASCAMPAFASAASPAFAQEATYNFNIPAQPMSSAIIQFSRQTGIAITAPRTVVSRRRSSPVRGQMTAAAALELMLRGSGLRFELGQGGSITILSRAGGEAAASGEAPAGGAAADSGSAEQEIVVTGSNIRQVQPIGSPVTRYSQADIRDSGFATVQDFLRVLPQNFAPGLADIQGGVGNFNRGVGVNLRGLGTGTTLTLVNGRRQPLSGDDGRFTDVSSLPASAIERVEILTDGASAVYGSDAIGGVINFILRRDFEGIETRGRIGTANGDSLELLGAALAGQSWSTGNVMVGYQYYRRNPLAGRDRDFTSTLDLRRFGGSDFRSNFSNPGNILNPNFTVAFAIPAGQDGTDLEPGDLIAGTRNPGEAREGVDLLSFNETDSAFASASQSLRTDLEASLEARFSRRSFRSNTNASVTTLTVPATNPFYVNAFGNGAPIRVSYSFIDDLGPTVFQGTTSTWIVAGGLDYSGLGAWRVRLNGAFGRERTRSRVTGLVNTTALNAALADPNPATAFNPFGDGSFTNPATLALIARVQENESRSDVWDAGIVADGPLFSLPGGPARLAVGGSFRRERLDSSRSLPVAREISAAFAELALPVLARADGGRLLALSAAARYDHYSDFGSTLNPKLAVQLEPVRGLTFRGSWGTSFRAPNLIDLDETATGGVPRVTVSQYQSPAGSPTPTTPVIQLTGNNSALREETATAWTLGADLSPAAVPNFSLSVTYYDISYRDRILLPGPLLASTILQQEALWSELITRNPPADQLASLCALVVSGSCAATPPVAIVDVRLRNIARLDTRGIDVNASYRLELPRGILAASVSGTYVLDYIQRVSSTSPDRSLLNTLSNPVDLRIRGIASYSEGPVTLSGGINYTTGYVDNVSVPSRRIGSWTTFDLGALVDLMGSGQRRGLSLAFRAVNLFNTDPPFVDNGLAFDPANASPLGRLFSVEAIVRW